MSENLEPARQVKDLLPEVYGLLSEVLALPVVDSSYVQALQRVLDEAQASEKAGYPFTLLPLLTCQAVGGHPRQAVPIAAACRALHITAKLLDDVEDGDVARLSTASTDPARVVNISTGFIVAASLALTRLAPDLWHVLQRDFNCAILRVAGGQHVDLTRCVNLDLEGYFEVIAAKSGACFALAARAGARCATADPVQLTRYEDFGYNVGILVQIADDLAGFRRPTGQGDLSTGHCTLPVLYALTVASPSERARLERFLALALSDRKAEAQARQLMVALGSEVYLLAEMARYRHRALTALESTEVTDATVEPLRDWLMLLK